MKKIIFFFSLLAAFSCQKTQEETPIEAAIIFEKPAHFPNLVYDFSKNPITKDGFKLGKALFYEGDLSSNGMIACGSCHIQSHAFSHHGHDVSHGVGDRLGSRNAPAIQNLAWQPIFFWDGGVHDLDLFSIDPIENPVEMNENFANVLEKIRKKAPYPELFRKAYGSPEITTERFLKALSQFMLMAVSANSKYDKFVRKEVSLEKNELEGMQIFKQKCASCHQGELFTDFSFRNTGLQTAFRKPDFGRYLVTLNETDRYKFKVPSLRNIAVTAPYMHDGRFYTLDEVLEHYNSQVKDLPNLDTLLKQNAILGIALSADEKQKLIAFLNTLTDKDFLTNPIFREENFILIK